MTTVKLTQKQKQSLSGFAREINSSAESARKAGVAIMETLGKVSRAFPDIAATALSQLLTEYGMTYAPVTIGIYIGTIRKAEAQGKDIGGMTNSEAILAIAGDGNTKGKGKGEPDKDALLAKLKKLAKQAQKAGASLEDICETIGLELA